MKVAELGTIHTTPPKGAKKIHPLGFKDIEKVSGVPNEELPLVVIVGIRGHDVTRCLIDEGSSADILYHDAFKRLGLRKADWESYDGTNLRGFNETSMRPWG